MMSMKNEQQIENEFIKKSDRSKIGFYREDRQIFQKKISGSILKKLNRVIMILNL